MRCYTVYLRPDRNVMSCQGISLFRAGKSPEVYALRLGRNGFLSNECVLTLCDGARTPDIQEGVNKTKVIYDAFPIETGVSEGVHAYKLSKPVKDDVGVALVRFNMGGQVPDKCRADCWPVAGVPIPIAVSMCAMDRRPWPRWAVDGLWVVNVGDVFGYENDNVKGKITLTEGGINEI